MKKTCLFVGDDKICPPLCEQVELLRMARETREIMLDIRRLATEINLMMLTSQCFFREKE